jgi:hypothetical protein
MNKTPRRNRPIATLLFVLAATSQLFAADASPLDLGSGEPGLKIIYKTTNQFVIFVDEPWTVGPGALGGDEDTRNIQVLSDHNYDLIEKLRSRSLSDFPQQLYAFDEQMAFTCEGGRWAPDYKTWEYWPRDTQLFSTNEDGLVVSNDVYTPARSRYGLTTNQLFLGRIGTNIFYWEQRDPRKVYYRGVVEMNATNCFELPKRVRDLYGVTKALHKNKDVGFMAFGKSAGFFHYSPYDFDLIEFSFKSAKRVNASND